jgi:hypothetical protein
MINMKYLFFLVLFVYQTMPSYGKSIITLEFHMGLGVEGKYKIGGTIKNSSSMDIPYGAITYITIDDNCNPSNAKVANFGPITANTDFEFNIPINGKMSSYRVLNISGWSKFGIPIKIEDRTENTIKERELDTMKKCNLKHNIR